VRSASQAAKQRFRLCSNVSSPLRRRQSSFSDLHICDSGRVEIGTVGQKAAICGLFSHHRGEKTGKVFKPSTTTPSGKLRLSQ
jgi:hypothetical protein